MSEVYGHTGSQEARPVPRERRKHRRLQMHLPVEFRRSGQTVTGFHHSVTRDVSTGGLYFETVLDDLGKGELLDIEMTIPPGEGHFPYQGRVSSVAKIVRADKPAADAALTNPRVGIGAAFRESFKLSF